MSGAMAAAILHNTPHSPLSLFPSRTSSSRDAPSVAEPALPTRSTLPECLPTPASANSVMMAGESVNYTNGWTPNMENFHLQCVQKAQGYAWMHFQASAFYTKLYLGLMIPCCILNVLVGSAGLASLSAIIGDPLWYLLLVIFGINILVGALGAVNGLLQPNLTSFQHRQLATEFVHLVRKLQAELLIEPARRIDCDDFGEMVNIEYENMLKNDLSVPEHIVHKFEESVNADTAMPEMILERGLRRDIFSAGTPRSGQSMSTQPVISMPPGRAEPIRRRVSEPCNSSRRVDSASERSRQNVPDVLPSSGSSSARVGSNWMTAFCAVQRARKGSARPSDSLMPDELPTSEPGVDNV